MLRNDIINSLPFGKVTFLETFNFIVQYLPLFKKYFSNYHTNDIIYFLIGPFITTTCSRRYLQYNIACQSERWFNGTSSIWRTKHLSSINSYFISSLLFLHFGNWEKNNDWKWKNKNFYRKIELSTNRKYKIYSVFLST